MGFYGRRYIGITSDTPGTRWNEGAGYEKQRRFNEAIRKYGWQNIKHEILEAGLTEIEAKKVETELIKEYRTRDKQFGYNMKVSIIDDVEENSQNQKQHSQKQFNGVEICEKIIEENGVKTVDGVIYYLKNSELVRELDEPFIEALLIKEFKIQEKKKRKEIVEMIKELSRAKREDVFATDDMGTILDQDQKKLLEAFEESGVSQISEREIVRLTTWLKETNEVYICNAMILDQALNISSSSCSQAILRRLAQVVRNNGWKPSDSVRKFSKYGKQRFFSRDRK